MLFTHSLNYLVAKAIPALLAFAALSIYTHLLSPDEYGLYTLAFSSALLLNAVFMNWLPAGTLRFWANNSYSDEELITTIVSTYLRIALALLLPFLIGVIYFLSSEIAIILIGTYLLSISISLYAITQNLLSSQILPLKYTQLTIMGSTLGLLLGGVLAYLKFGAMGILIGSSLGFLIPSLLTYKNTWVNYNKKKYSKSLLKKLLVYGIPIGSAFFLEEVIKSADRFMLAGFHDKAQAGLYAVGYDISGNSIFMLMAALNTAAYPVIIKLLENEGRSAALEYFNKYVILLMGVSIPAIAGLIMVGPNLIHLVIGQEYQGSVAVLLPWITTALFFMGLQAFYFDLSFQLGHYTLGIVKVGIVIAIVNVGLNYLLIPPMGIVGAAIATLSSFALGSIISAIYAQKWFPLPFPFKEFVKITIATLFMVLILWGLRGALGWPQLIMQMTLGMLSYLFIVILFNVLNIRDNIKAKLSKNE